MDTIPCPRSQATDENDKILQTTPPLIAHGEDQDLERDLGTILNLNVAKGLYSACALVALVLCCILLAELAIGALYVSR